MLVTVLQWRGVPSYIQPKIHLSSYIGLFVGFGILPSPSLFKGNRNTWLNCTNELLPHEYPLFWFQVTIRPPRMNAEPSKPLCYKRVI